MRHFGALPRVMQIALLSTAFVLLGWQAKSSDAQGTFAVIGNGTRSCGQWTEEKKSFRQRKLGPKRCFVCRGFDLDNGLCVGIQ